MTIDKNPQIQGWLKKALPQLQSPAPPTPTFSCAIFTFWVYENETPEKFH